MEQQKKNGFENIALMQMAFQIGWIIVIPLVIFAFGGAYLDKVMNTSPLFLFAGLVLAVTSSSLGVYRIVKQVLPAETPRKPAEQTRSQDH